jgi:hypothetical protein
VTTSDPHLPGARVALVWAGLSLALAACSSASAVPSDAADAAAPEAAAPTDETCQDIRLCVFDQPCADDACIAACAARGTAAARATFEMLRACTAQACSPTNSDYLNCACAEQCFGEGACLPLVDACVGPATADMVCDSLCN